MSQSTHAYALLQRYHYDAVSRLISVQVPGSPAHRRYYAGAVLGNELTGDVRRSHLNMGGGLSGIREQANGAATVRLFGAEQQGSVLHVLGEGGPKSLAYTPHGKGADPTLPGFNGEQPDPITGNYLLGNGYRAYNPTLMRFHSSDSFSPFGGGGLNPYTYCLGDPINRTDPTGHLSLRAMVSIGIGLVTFGWGGYSLVYGGLSFSTAMAASTAAVISSASGLASVGVGVALTVLDETAPDSEAVEVLGYIALGLEAVTTLSAIATSILAPPKPKPEQLPPDSISSAPSVSLEMAPLQRVSGVPLDDAFVAARRISERVRAGGISPSQDVNGAPVRSYWAIPGGYAWGFRPSQLTPLPPPVTASESPAQRVRSVIRRNSYS